jgi:hypothetical protein
VQATDLSHRFVQGSIPNGIAMPEPSTLSALVFGLSTLASGGFISRKKRG